MVDFYFDKAGFDNVIRCGTINYFDGWAYSQDPIREIVFCVDEKIGSLPIRKHRPDLEKVFHQSHLGFSGVIDIPESCLGKTLKTFAITKSGQSHALKQFTLTERLSVEEEQYRKEHQLPSGHLMHLVVFNTDPKTFFEQGKQGKETVEGILSENGINDIRTILDFGVGCGRVIRWWNKEYDLFGTDINPLLVDWCRNNLQGEFTVNGLRPPVKYQDNQFDLLYAFSVFTHLAIETQIEWLKEFQRIVKPGKYLLISVHGDYHSQFLAREVQEEYRKKGYYVLSLNAEGENMCATYQSKDFSEKAFSKYFTILGYYPKALNACGNQDLFLLKSNKKEF